MHWRHAHSHPSFVETVSFRANLVLLHPSFLCRPLPLPIGETPLVTREPHRQTPHQLAHRGIWAKLHTRGHGLLLQRPRNQHRGGHADRRQGVYAYAKLCLATRQSNIERAVSTAHMKISIPWCAMFYSSCYAIYTGLPKFKFWGRSKFPSLILL